MAKRLIIIPTGIEAAQILEKLGAEKSGDRLYSSPDKATDIFICGAGMPASIMNTSLFLADKSYNLIILAGIAGSFKDSIQIGELVNVKTENFADLGYSEHGEFGNFFHLKEWSESYLGGSITNPNQQIMNTLPCKQVTSNTVNLCNIEKKGIPEADIENMEGAGLFLLFNKLNIPFLEIRAISNMVRERNKANWNIPMAVENLTTELLNLLKS